MFFFLNPSFRLFLSLSFPRHLCPGLLRFDRAAQDLQPPGPFLRRAPDTAGDPGRAADGGGTLWLLEALGEADCGGVAAALVVQAGPASPALLAVQTGRHPPAYQSLHLIVITCKCLCMRAAVLVKTEEGG